MNCITSPALDDTQIMSYIEGEGDDRVIAHIRECRFCSERANRWALLQDRLRKNLYRVNCPTPMELGDYHLELLPAPQALIMAQHVRECALCRRELGELGSFMEDSIQEVGLLGAAKVWIARLINGQTETENQSNNGFMPAKPVLRGKANGPLTFKAESVVIVLDIQPATEGKINILGQLAADNAGDQDQWTGALVEIRQNSRLEFSTTLDDLGSFYSEDILPGLKELQITSKAGTLIVLSDFEVSALDV
jgi:hypothetical protein